MCTGIARAWGTRARTSVCLKLQPLCLVQAACSHRLLAANDRSESESKVTTPPYLHTGTLRNKQQNNQRHSEQSFAWSLICFAAPIKSHQVSAACHSTTRVVVTEPQRRGHHPIWNFRPPLFKRCESSISSACDQMKSLVDWSVNSMTLPLPHFKLDQGVPVYCWNVTLSTAPLVWALLTVFFITKS